MTSTEPVVLNSANELAEFVQSAHALKKTVALVPTMGALHSGHRALVTAAQEVADVIIVSDFVNPTQFGPNEDFDRYPRTLDADVHLLAGAADAVFAPSVEDVYPGGVESGSIRQFSSGPVGETFEGAARPGHFDGMLTVVARLFDLAQPDVAIFGEKDAQQAFFVDKLIRDDYPHMRLLVVPTVRDEFGLALSSRNRYLSDEDREQALVLPRALSVAAETASREGGTPSAARQAAMSVFEAAPLVRLEYFDLVSPETFEPVADGFVGTATAIVAAKVGTTRLLDTRKIDFR